MEKGNAHYLLKEKTRWLVQNCPVRDSPSYQRLLLCYGLQRKVTFKGQQSWYTQACLCIWQHWLDNNFNIFTSYHFISKIKQHMLNSNKNSIQPIKNGVGNSEIKEIVNPQVIQDINEFISSLEQIWENLLEIALHHLLTNGSSAVNGWIQTFDQNVTVIHMTPVHQLTSCETKLHLYIKAFNFKSSLLAKKYLSINHNREWRSRLVTRRDGLQRESVVILVFVDLLFK